MEAGSAPAREEMEEVQAEMAECPEVVGKEAARDSERSRPLWDTKRGRAPRYGSVKRNRRLAVSSVRADCCVAGPLQLAVACTECASFWGFIEFIESIIGIVVRRHTLYLCSLPTYVNKS